MRKIKNFNAWYVNANRLIQAFGPALALRVPASVPLYQVNALTANALANFISAGEVKIPMLQELILNGDVKAGQCFAVINRFWGNGVASAACKSEGGMASIHTGKSAMNFAPGYKLTFKFHTKNLMSNSAIDALSGPIRTMYALGFVTSVRQKIIHASPGIIADIIDTDSAWAPPQYGEVMPDRIDQFSCMKTSLVNWECLRQIPEKEIKKAFAEIIGEPFVPKDWGGEQCDLLSPRVRLDGRAISAAFCFKGPGNGFKPLTIAQLGKNGDQIARLFETPANLLVMQHCHGITAYVKNSMKQYANQSGNRRYYCAIDGPSTAQILLAHGKFPELIREK